VKSTLFFLTLLLCGFHSAAQDAILQFSVVQVENNIQLNFTLKAGYTCNGIGIYRSADSINFTLIGDIQGVCGSNDRNESYTFTDYSPLKNSKNFYRLQPGSLETSGIAGVFFIDLSENDVLVYPNPLTSASAVYTLNTSHEERTMEIFTRDGKHIYKSKASRGSSFPLPADHFIPGIYYFTIMTESIERFKGSFTVQ
jgi:hypothetical protein